MSATGRTPNERFAAQKMASKGNCYVCVLKCQHGKWAVGYTESLSLRMNDHFSGNGSSWTKKHRPLFKIPEELRMVNIEDALGWEEALQFYARRDRQQPQRPRRAVVVEGPGRRSAGPRRATLRI